MRDKPISDLTIEELEREVEYHDYQYWVLHAPAISDEEYDLLVRRLKQLRPDSSVLSRVGGAFATDAFGREVRHARPMLSLDKCYTPAEFDEWLLFLGRELYKLLSGPEHQDLALAFEELRRIPPRSNDDALLAAARRFPVTVSPKIDGVAASLTYDAKGVLALAATRGSGLVGEDFTLNSRLIGGIPWSVGLPGIEVRGEVHMKRSVFTAKYGSSFANPRNLTAGTLKQKESSRDQLLDLSFLAYDLIGRDFPSEQEKHAALCSLGFVPVQTRFVAAAEVPTLYEQLLADKDRGDVDVDGIVIRLADCRLHPHLGITAHHPRYAIAFKFQGDTGFSTLRSIEWGVSRTGTITPVATVDPVPLSGATVSRSSLHNIAILRGKSLRLGDQVQLTRRGGVIPHVEASLGGGTEPVTVPTTCPACGSETLLAAPQAFVAGARLDRFADQDQALALIRWQRQLLEKGSLFSLLDQTNRIARKSGDGRYRDALTWKKDDLPTRKTLSDLLNRLPALRTRPAEALLLVVVDPAVATSVRMLDMLIPLAAQEKLDLRILLASASRYEEQAAASAARAGLLAAGRSNAFFAALAALLSDAARAALAALTPANGDFSEETLAACAHKAYELSDDFLTCSSPPSCPDAQLGLLQHFIQTLGVDGFGDKVVRTLFASGHLRSPEDFFRLRAEDLVPLERLGEILASKLVQNVQAARKVSLSLFLQSLGVDELARFVSEQLEQKCSGLDEILSLTEDDLAGAPASDGAGTPFTGIKFGIAHPVVHGLRRARPLIARLRQVLEITGPAAAPLPGRAPFAGLSFVFTGRMRSLERKAAQAQVAALGGKTPDDVTADLSFLVIGDEGSPLFGQGAKGSKQVKAEKHLARGAHIRIISESEFLKRLQEAQGKI